MEQSNKSLKQILTEAMDVKNINIPKLCDLTEVPEKYTKAFIEGDYAILPSAPYTRGYLVKIAKELDLDGQIIWQLYRKELSLKSSGEADKLPINRFAFKKSSSKKFFIFLIVVITAGILAFKASQFFGMPPIEISNPIMEQTITKNSSITLRGKINSQDRLSINNEDTAIDKSGYFEKNFLLEQGVNTIEFKVKRLLGKEIKIIKQVVYQP